MNQRTRKNHFGARIAERMAREQNPAPPDETPEPEPARRRSPFDFERKLEQRIRDKEAGE